MTQHRIRSSTRLASARAECDHQDMQRITLCLGLAVLLGACRAEPVDETLRRGRDTERAELTHTERANAYATALRSAFDIPGTALLIDPRMLAAEGGYDEAARIPEDVSRALRATGTVQGECVPTNLGEDRAPACPSNTPGYAVRFSEVYDVEGDTLRVHLVAERYRPAADTLRYHSPFRMEERYHLTRNGNRWRVARKERMRL